MNKQQKTQSVGENDTIILSDALWTFRRVGRGVGQAGFPHLAAKSNRKVDSLFLRKKPRRLQRATGTLLRAAFRIHLRLKSKNSDHPDGCSEFLVGEGGFEPPKSLTTDLQSAPFGHSGIPPYSLCCAAEDWSW